jgi:hypothetical protein
MGHIINLAAQAFLFGAEYEIFDKTYKAYEEAQEDETTKLWEMKGSVGKFHYIVIYIQRNP